MNQAILLGIITLFISLPTEAQPTWKTTKSAVTFTIRNAGFNVDGSFSGFAGNLAFDPAAPDKAQLIATVETATLNTDNSLRDGHLKKPDYFDAAAHPRITLKSVQIAKKGANEYVGTFNLTLKGVTRPVQVPFTFVRNGTAGTFAGSFTINRVDYGVGKKSFLLSNDVTITLKIDVQPGASTVADR
ncbi:MAG: YceI family protein [Bacteroidetes bacterium]|nr:YceI family protein [Fibrella sp.]